MQRRDWLKMYRAGIGRESIEVLTKNCGSLFNSPPPPWPPMITLWAFSHDISFCARQKDVNARPVEKLTMWTIKFPQIKNPTSIVNRITRCDIFEDKILLGMKYWQIKHTNYKLAIHWSRCPDFKRMHLAEWRVPGKMMLAFISFCHAPDNLNLVWNCMVHNVKEFDSNLGIDFHLKETEIKFLELLWANCGLKL